MVQDSSKKKRNLIAFFKLFLRDVKVETLWISWDFLAFFRDFSTTPSYVLWVTPQFFAKSKFSWRYIIVLSFISIAFVVAKLRIIKCFPTSKNYHCRLLLGGFLILTPPNAVKFFWNLKQQCSPIFQYNASHVLQVLI